MGAHPFRIQSTPNGSTGTPYNDGITNNDVVNGTLIWEVQFDSPDKLYYQCTAHPDMGGRIYLSYPSNQLPGGILSGSQQITDLGFISSSDSTTSLNTFTSSIQTEVDGISAATSSYLTSSGSVDYTDLTFRNVLEKSRVFCSKTS